MARHAADGGQESTLLALYNTIHHSGGIVVAPGYTDPTKFVDGTPYGASPLDDATVLEPEDVDDRRVTVGDPAAHPAVRDDVVAVLERRRWSPRTSSACSIRRSTAPAIGRGPPRTSCRRAEPPCLNPSSEERLRGGR
jgi:hypothetical protein